MRGKFYKYLRKVCGAIGWLGEKIKFWAEFKEWNYWHEEQCKIIDVPNDVKVFLSYNRKGEFLRVAITYWPMVNGKYDWNRPEVFSLDLTKEKIRQIATKTEGEDA